jgi:hypothetical protein
LYEFLGVSHPFPLLPNKYFFGQKALSCLPLVFPVHRSFLVIDHIGYQIFKFTAQNLNILKYFRVQGLTEMPPRSFAYKTFSCCFILFPITPEVPFSWIPYFFFISNLYKLARNNKTKSSVFPQLFPESSRVFPSLPRVFPEVFSEYLPNYSRSVYPIIPQLFTQLFPECSPQILPEYSPNYSLSIVPNYSMSIPKIIPLVFPQIFHEYPRLFPKSFPENSPNYSLNVPQIFPKYYHRLFSEYSPN